jgi:hypothetical protein
MVTSKSAGCRAATLSREPFPDGAIRHDTNRRREGAYVNVKLTVTVTIASKPIGVYVHCLTASIAACAKHSVCRSQNGDVADRAVGVNDRVELNLSADAGGLHHGRIHGLHFPDERNTARSETHRSAAGLPRTDDACGSDRRRRIRMIFLRFVLRGGCRFEGSLRLARLGTPPPERHRSDRRCRPRSHPAAIRPNSRARVSF